MIDNIDVIIRLLLSIVLCGLIGLERKFYHKPAGFRTNILVGLGSTVMMLIGINILKTFGNENAGDISRIAGQIVTGIGFLGAGVIIQGRGSIHGLTTAASIWVVSAIGMAVGLGFYFMAVAATIAALIVLIFLGRIEHQMEHRHDDEKKEIPENNQL